MMNAVDNYNFKVNGHNQKSLYVDRISGKNITDSLYEVGKGSLAIFDETMNLFLAYKDHDDVAFDYQNLRMSFDIAKTNYELDKNNKYYKDLFVKATVKLDEAKDLFLRYKTNIIVPR